MIGIITLKLKKGNSFDKLTWFFCAISHSRSHEKIEESWFLWAMSCTISTLARSRQAVCAVLLYSSHLKNIFLTGKNTWGQFSNLILTYFKIDKIAVFIFFLLTRMDAGKIALCLKSWEHSIQQVFLQAFNNYPSFKNWRAKRLLGRKKRLLQLP